MATSVVATELGPEGQACPQCGEPLRADQRYCLNCGRRRTQTRLAFLEVVGPHGPGAASAAAPPPGSQPAAQPPRERSPLVALCLLLALLLALGIGVLLGRGAREPQVAARAPVVNVSAAPVVSDWPASKDGWTIG